MGQNSTHQANAENITKVSISPIGRNKENIKSVPISVQDGINLASVSVWTESFRYALWHPAPLILPIQDGGHLIPIDGIPFGSDVLLDETITRRGVLEYPGRG